MANVLQILLEAIIREEESLNRQYDELISCLDQTELIEKVKKYQAQGWARIGELHGMWRSQAETKP